MFGRINLSAISSTLQHAIAVSSSGSSNKSRFCPTIILLQELDSYHPRSRFVNQARELAKSLGLHSVYYDSMSMMGLFGFGNAILTNMPVHSTWNRILPVRAAEPRCIMAAAILFNGIKLHVYNTHWGLSEKERETTSTSCAELIRKDACYDPVVFGGDLNARIESDEVARIESGTGLTSVGSDDQLRTFPSDSPRVRIDHLFTSRHFGVEAVYTVRSMASDHLPLVARLTYRAAAEE